MLRRVPPHLAALFRLLLGRNLDRRDWGLGLGNCLGLGLGLGVVLQSAFALQIAQLNAVGEQLFNEPALRSNDVALFDHQHDEEAVGDHEQDGQDGQQGIFGAFGFWDWRA